MILFFINRFTNFVNTGNDFNKMNIKRAREDIYLNINSGIFKYVNIRIRN